MLVTKLTELTMHLQPGKTYRRSDLALFSKSIDRHLKELVRLGTLRKLRAGVYYYPKQSTFGEVPADDYQLIRTFLKDHRFLLTSLNAYNGLGLGTTQLYNKQMVYNHKRHGEFVFSGRTYDFRIKHHFPLHALNEEFLLVDLVNNINELAEDREALLTKVREKASSMNSTRLKRAIHEFANTKTKLFFLEILK